MSKYKRRCFVLVLLGIVLTYISYGYLLTGGEQWRAIVAAVCGAAVATLGFASFVRTERASSDPKENRSR